MKKKHLLFSCVLLFFLSCSKSNKNNKSEKSSDSISIYFSLIDEEKLSTKEKLKYNNNAYSIISKESNTVLNREDLFNVGINFDKLKDNLKFRNTSLLLLKNAVDAKDSLNIERAYKNLGKYHIDMYQNDSSYYYYLKAEKFASYLKDTLSLGEIYIDKAFIQMYEDDFYGSQSSALKALKFLNLSKNRFKIYDAYNIVGINSNQLKNYEKSLEYHNKALNYLRDNNLNNKYHLDANSLNNIGYVYQNLDKHKEAIKNFNLALQSKSLSIDNPSLYAMLLDNLAYSKFKLRDFSQLPDLFYKSLKIRDSLNIDESGRNWTKIHLSELYAAKKDSIKAQLYAKEALDNSRKIKLPSDILASLKQLSIVEHKNSSKYSKEYIKINDSIQQEERKTKERFARIAYETDEIIGQNDKLEEKNRTLLYFFIGTFAVGLLLFVIRTQRAKNRELLLKQQQQKVNEEIYNLMISQQATIEENRVKEKKRIAQELHDGVLGRMFGARLTLDSLNSFTDEESIKSRFNYLNELKNIEQDIREISHDLSREKSVLVNNFVAIVNNLIEEQKTSYQPNIKFSLDDSIKWELIDNTTKINLYRIVQESLQNVNKYAQAKNIKVTFKKDIDNIVLKIVDDGIGFDTIGRKKGIGLQNMEARAKECEGIFEVLSKKGKGATISISVPMIKNKVTI
ncbi:tetratricopeptide repeat-containing sensor histidine kinase [Flavobacterium luteum]|uniref:histidine kinase n=1 Tax=Flavobacterium luteum TaxID=2026654 RepID=A0A7J5AES4_9FLAO|nr:sensor histidine kinase [Flavobacterium luteum]KAB1156072.1 tetratricopeptide repeat protein [Flavobacterium luteum]